MAVFRFFLLLAALFISIGLAAFDQNQAGAVLKAPDGDSFTSVSGTFVVPALSGNNKLSIWVAIGDTAQQDVVLKGGITYDRGLTTFAGWYPASNIDITSSAPIASGDSITVTISVPSKDKRTGMVVVENTTTNQKAAQQIFLPASVDPSKLTSLVADWFIQAYQVAGELVQVPQFDTLTFTTCSATLASGKSVGPMGAGTFEIQGTSGQIYSKTTLASDRVSIRQQL